jgi:4-hydroxybenzoate polyprenyltransferase
MARSPASSASPASPASLGDTARVRSLFTNLLLSLRPSQWTKNLFVLAALGFAGRLFQPESVWRAFGAFAIFCVLSGIVYLINDVRDRDADRLHPVKSRRPIASGALSVSAATTAAVVLTVVALAAAFTLDVRLGIVSALYLALFVFYSFWLKHLVILDVLTIAVGFVLRAIAGAVAIDVRVSNWLLLLTLLLALFLGLSKRRAELVSLADDAKSHRRSLAEYSPYLLDQMISVVTASTLVAYAFYTISPETQEKFHTEHLLYTVPFPLYGIFRYLYLVHQREGGGNPSEVLLTDRPLLACVALWAAVVVAILYGPWR